MRYFLFVLVLFVSIPAITCQYKTSRGTFDLTPVSGTEYPTLAPTGHYYYFTLCANEAGSSNCKDPLSGFCAIQAMPSTHDCWGLATWDNSGKAAATSDGFSIQFDNGSGDQCPSEAPRSTKFTFSCDEQEEIGQINVKEKEGQSCSYELKIPTKYVCPEYIISSGSSSSGLSFGSIFLIILLVLIAVYFIAGFGFNKYKGSEERIPHSSFWCTQLPFWVKTGLMVSWAFTVNMFSRIRTKITGGNAQQRRTTEADEPYETLD